jgi:hypothetical protein
MFVCPHCTQTFEDSEGILVLENPADPNSRWLKVCKVCAQSQARNSALAGFGLLACIVAALLAFFSFCRP